MPAHKHAALIKQYAEDALISETPWEFWEVCGENKTKWQQCKDEISFFDYFEYRRNPKTIKVNGFEVPEPCRKPLNDGDFYYRPEPQDIDYFLQECWSWRNWNCRHLERGLVHLTKEAAIAHAKAMLGIDPEGDEND